MRYRLPLVTAAVGITLLPACLILLHEPAPKAGENGTFANDCCGTVELSDGRMSLNGGPGVRYTVSRDANGPYVLPHTYVGVVPYEGFEVDGTRSVLKLRLDRLPAPTRIMLYEGLRPYIFTRPTLRRIIHAGNGATPPR